MVNTLIEPLRTQVLWFGADPAVDVRQELANRGLEIVVGPATLDPAILAGSRGAVFAIGGGSDAGERLPLVGRELADHGLLICVAAPDDAAQGLAGGLVKGLPADQVERRTAPGAHVLPELFARHDPGPRAVAGFNPVRFDNVKPLSPSDLSLMSRAFGHCGEVRLEELTGGLSGARVFSVHTTIGNSFGSWAQPLFAKLDRREKVAREAANYEAAAPFVPFGLRPNIHRTILGASRGVLVGNLVDGSESLWDVARRGHASQAIFNLFSNTLGGWRGQGLRAPPVQGALWPVLVRAGIVDPKRVRAEYLEGAGVGVSQPDAIAARLGGLQQAYRVGQIHGDLHAQNVRVKGADAILIDLASSQPGPLSADLAMLETWLAFEVHPRDQSSGWRDDVWGVVIRKLYAADTFATQPSPCDGGDQYGWMWDAVRQIRGIGLLNQSCPTEYRTAVIAALMRRCMFECDTQAGHFRRVTAYAIADTLSLGLQAEGIRYVA